MNRHVEEARSLASVPPQEAEPDAANPLTLDTPSFSAELPIDSDLNTFQIDLTYPDGTELSREIQLLRR